MKVLLLVVSVLIASGCTTVKYNGSDTFVKEVSYPETGKV